MRPKLILALLMTVLIAAPIAAAPVTAPAGNTSANRNARQQPIQIEADRAEITEQSGVSVYSGSVTLKQGDLEMAGDRLEIRRDSETGNILALLSGKPAVLNQPTETGEMVKASANRIDYNSSNKSLDLQGNAQYARGRDRVSGQNIRYDANAKKLLATGPNREGERVQIIIQSDQTESAP